MSTRAMIVKLNNLIMPRYEAYRTRRVPISISPFYVSGGNQIAVNPSSAAVTRLNALHEIMRLELPDRMTDIVDPPITVTSYVGPATATGLTAAPGSSAISRPAVNQAFYNAIVNSITHGVGPAPALVVGGNVNSTNQGAECLYMIVTMGFVDELGGRELFNESQVNDTDGDGLPEFIDAWGTPIGFLRWTPGFTESELNGAGGIGMAVSGTTVAASGLTTQFSSYGLSPRGNAYVGRIITVYSPPTAPGAWQGSFQSAVIASSTYNSDGSTTLNLAGSGITSTSGISFGIDPDPFDPRMAYAYGQQASSTFGATYAMPFAIFPLIYSAGADKTFGVVSEFGTTLHYSQRANYPFLVDDTGGSNNGQAIGTPSDLQGEQAIVTTWTSGGWKDNIHNHIIGQR
jgi:hypothetical protein